MLMNYVFTLDSVFKLVSLKTQNDKALTNQYVLLIHYSPDLC